MQALVVRSRLPSRTLVVDALYGEDDRGQWTALPLAKVTPTDVPYDIGQDPSRVPLPAGPALGRGHDRHRGRRRAATGSGSP